MRRHLASTAGDVRCGSDRLQELFFYSVAESEADGAVAVVRKEPVVTGLQRHSGGYEQCFMAGAGDLEEDLLLPLEHNLAVICFAGKVHEPVKLHQLVPGQLRGYLCFDSLQDASRFFWLLCNNTTRVTRHAMFLLFRFYHFADTIVPPEEMGTNVT